ncbi:MAG: aspartate aminotransferase family protein [Nitratireductor sp.]
MSRNAQSVDHYSLASIIEGERSLFTTTNPKSGILATQAEKHLYGGVPMHWMADWSTPYPLFVASASDASITDVDGNTRFDFCLGDTGAMFGHSPEPVAQAIREQAGNGYTTMLPGEDAVVVAGELASRFGLPFWQVAATATDANRAVIRWARAVTKRPVLLVFDGCYHGTVDDCMVRLKDGRTVARPGLVGQVTDYSKTTRVVEFNDLAALEAVLEQGDVAALLCEPAMTNIGMVMPDPGFHDAIRSLTRKHGTLLIIDETHTISTGPGGYTKAHGLEPDFLVMGKPVAGGIPACVYGFTAQMADAMNRSREAVSHGDGHGHSGIGTTLSANAFAMHAMRANLTEVMTEAAYGHMTALAETLAATLREVISRHGVDWCVTQIGARVEFQFCPTPPRTGREAEAAFNDPLERAIHLLCSIAGFSSPLFTT